MQWKLTFVPGGPSLLFTNWKFPHMAVMAGRPPPLAEPPSLPNHFKQASNKTVQLGTAISLPVDDVLARMSPNTPTEDALLDLYLKSMPDTHSIRV
jgi:hypothetical protein